MLRKGCFSFVKKAKLVFSKPIYFQIVHHFAYFAMYYVVFWGICHTIQLSFENLLRRSLPPALTVTVSMKYFPPRWCLKCQNGGNHFERKVRGVRWMVLNISSERFDQVSILVRNVSLCVIIKEQNSFYQHVALFVLHCSSGLL